jgi:hypothetical protein
MAKYLLLWEINREFMPEDPKEASALVVSMAEKVKRGIEDGRTVDWGMFIDGDQGYSISQLEPQDLYLRLQQFWPYVRFEVHEVLSVDDLIRTHKTVSG